MAQSDISGQYDFGPKITCILKEGNITVSSRAYANGIRQTVCTFASELYKDDVVALSTDTGNTYAATDGLPVVTAVSNGVDLVCGKIISEPVWVKEPTSSQTTWATMLAGGYYRIATVQLWNCIAVFDAVLVTADAVAVTPGGTTLLDFDVSAITARTYDVPVVNDIAGAAGSADVFSFHYQAKAAGAVVSVLLGVKGFGTAAT